MKTSVREKVVAYFSGVASAGLLFALLVALHDRVNVAQTQSPEIAQDFQLFLEQEVPLLFDLDIS